MKYALITVSFVALLLLVVAPVAVFTRAFTLETAKTVLLTGTVAWFATAPFWMDRPQGK